MSVAERLEALNLSDDTNLTFTYEDGCGVHHYTDDFIEEAMRETGIVYTLSEAITTGPLYRHGNEVLQEMRDNGLLDDYPRDGSGFQDYVTEVIANNYWEYDWIPHTTNRYDYKRGHTTFTLEFDVPYAHFKEDPEAALDAFHGWTVSVSTDNGTLVLD